MKAAAMETAERLLIEAAQKDPGRFAELYDNNFNLVYAYVLRRVRNRAEAEDVTSEVFHHALANLSSFEWRGVPFAAWLFKIASNAIIDRAKRANREQDLSVNLEPSIEANFQEIQDEIEQRARLYQFLDQLPATQRRVIVMRFGDEKSIREIALELGRTEGAVKQLQFRALQTLRTQLADSPGDTNG